MSCALQMMSDTTRCGLICLKSYTTAKRSVCLKGRQMAKAGSKWFLSHLLSDNESKMRKEKKHEFYFRTPHGGISRLGFDSLTT